MRLAEQLSKTDRAIGIGGLILAIVALASTTQRIEVSGDAEVVPAIVGASMVLWVLLATVRHHRAHRGGRGRGWLIAGWVVLGINLVWSLFQALDTSAFDDGFWHGLKEFATGPPIMMVVVPLVLSSIAILCDGADPPPKDISLDSDGPSQALKVPGQATDEAANCSPSHRSRRDPPPRGTKAETTTRYGVSSDWYSAQVEHPMTASRTN